MATLALSKPLAAMRAAARWWRAPAVARRRLSKTRRSDPRVRIAAWAIGLGLVSGVIHLMEPIEDGYRAARALTRLRPADQSVVVVSVDDRSLNELGVAEPRRSDDAKVVDRAFALGARRVFFDRAFADPTTWEEDRQLVEAFERHKGRVYIGGTPAEKQVSGTLAAIVPHERFRNSAHITSMVGISNPLGLSTVFPTSSTILGKERPSLSAALAGVDRPFEHYRVDFSVDYETIPTIEYVDFVKGQVSTRQLAGKDVLVTPSSRSASDYHYIPFREYAPGAYFHVLGAETLKGRYPIDLGWLPAFLLAAGFVFLKSRKRQPSIRWAAAATGVVLAAPAALDLAKVNLDIMPALIVLGVGSYRLIRLARETYHAGTGLRRIESIYSFRREPECDVIALKIRNFATISASLPPEGIDLLLSKAQGMLQATEPDAQFAFHKDTFVWLRPALAASELDSHVHGLHALFRTSISIGAQAPDLASSIGVDINRGASLRERIESAIQSAEDAAHAGRIYLVSEIRAAEERAWSVQILSELENAIRADEVGVAYQPKVDLATGRIVGAEALLRWVHPTRGAIEPSKVIESAEQHNRVDMITRYVLNRALREGREALKYDPDFRMAVNISALDLRDPAFARQVRSLIGAYRFPAANLVLEITETAPIENDKVVAASLAALKKMGVKLSVDDFGSGHASLHYLRQIPADEVKIDRSFVVGMERSPEDRALMQAAIEMIRSLGRSVVAEGVENAGVGDLLRKMGCETAQGYFFSKAIPMDVLVSKLTKRSAAA